jgi:HAD superfamily hydrolase (TIGR01509 family)
VNTSCSITSIAKPRQSTNSRLNPFSFRSCKAVIFDLDGVLVDSYDSWFHLLNDVLQQAGKRRLTREEFHKTWGQGPEADREEFLPEWKLEDLLALYDRRFPEYTRFTRSISGSRDCLIQLRSMKVKVGVASNSPTNVVRASLRAADLQNLVDVAIGSDQVENEKPAPDMILKALDVLKLEKQDVCYIGDSIFDQRAAGAAGVFFVGFCREGDFSIQTLEEFTRLFETTE